MTENVTSLQKNKNNHITPIRAKSDKLADLLEHLDKLKKRKFTGYIKINFTQGTLARIEQFEEILK